MQLICGPGDRAVDAIVIPVKALAGAKQRLAEHLSPEDRARIGLAMLADVLTETAGWECRYLVTSDPRAAELGISFGYEVVVDKGAGLNSALEWGTQHAVSAGARRLLVLPADVPAVTREDVEMLFSYPEDVVVCSSEDGGTNAILRSPPAVIRPAFGPGSAEVHLEAARQAGLTAKQVQLESLILDVDDLDDLKRLAGLPLERKSVVLARELAGG